MAARTAREMSMSFRVSAAEAERTLEWWAIPCFLRYLERANLAAMEPRRTRKVARE